ncbi:hypothetical protein CXB51_020362 [Gossypium anomalum]|uniref:Aminotransferase-like plant mobile domain-containing protein n=1 Tax=Gossypium anomalum TaxID=47600 RepID=A0A8J5Z1W6_9ROSI|nr:hypothetical protein CXB51_020362 [Gossypium anomalum]
MASLINKELSHICDTVNNTDSYRILRGRVNGVGYSPDARLMPYLELAGSGSAALTRTSDLRYDLISALVERWRPETYTFHLPCGECTVTLEDVTLQFGLPIDGDAVTGVSAIAEPAALCYSLLGASPGDAESTFSELKFTWLKANFQHLSDNATEEELVCAARAYIMHIIGGVLMPNSNNNKLGSAVLVMLYRELCRTTKPDAVDMGGCLILLQSWALYRMPFLASVSHQPYVYPLVNRWSIYPGIGRSYTVPIYRLMIEQHAGEGFIWMPYRRPKIAAIIPSSAYVDSHLWCTNVPIISFNVVEWYHGDRVLRQFGGGGGLRQEQERETWTVLGGYAPEIYCSVGESDGSKTSDGYVFRFAPIVRRSGAYEPVADIEIDPQPDAEHDPEPEPEVQPEAESEQSYSHSTDTSYHPDLAGNDYFSGSSSHSHLADTSYHPNLAGNDYFPGSSGGGYHYGFDMFKSYPPQHSTSPGPYPPHYSTTPGPYPLQYSTPTGLYPTQHGTPPGSSSSMPFEPYDFSFMYQTPSPATEEDVGHRNHPQRERRPPQKYTPRTTPSNHQF